MSILLPFSYHLYAYIHLSFAKGKGSVEKANKNNQQTLVQKPDTFFLFPLMVGSAVAQKSPQYLVVVVKALCCKPEGHGFDTR
jgi:hypothetical protein